MTCLVQVEPEKEGIWQAIVDEAENLSFIKSLGQHFLQQKQLGPIQERIWRTQKKLSYGFTGLIPRHQVAVRGDGAIDPNGENAGALRHSNLGSAVFSQSRSILKLRVPPKHKVRDDIRDGGARKRTMTQPPMQILGSIKFSPVQLPTTASTSGKVKINDQLGPRSIILKERTMEVGPNGAVVSVPIWSNFGRRPSFDSGLGRRMSVISFCSFDADVYPMVQMVSAPALGAYIKLETFIPFGGQS
ncbi:hypothetical protein B0H19DRAFT_1056793 [Mycena capillaripes]|nr:hypothetical protein B0H19DRAFT_1056793 [Mycena capillaripes]